MSKLKKAIFVVTILFGIAINIYPALTQPIWLDEVYSVYFAHNFSASQLLFRLDDVHPGGYYLILKIILYLTTNLFLLRLITSVIPFLLACFLIYRQQRSYYLVLFLLFNPFFIHSSWQLRMYGLCILLTVYISNLFFSQASFIKKASLSLVSIFISFNLIIPIICLAFYDVFIHRQKKSLLIIVFIIFSFFIIKGPNYKTYAEKAAWINPPSFSNIPSVISTTLGMDIDTQNVVPYQLGYSLLFFTIFLPFIYHLSRSNPKFAFGFTLPLFLTITVSILFPIISQRHLFYLFIPKISLFLPRYLIPIFIIFFIQGFNRHQKTKAILLIFFCLFWIRTYYLINHRHYYSPATPINSTSTLILPPWENLRLSSSFTSNDLSSLATNYRQALDFEKVIISQPSICPTTNHTITYLNQPFNSMTAYQQQILTFLEKCCQPTSSTNPDSFVWKCPKSP